jgi:hypothetical protein
MLEILQACDWKGYPDGLRGSAKDTPSDFITPTNASWKVKD